MKMEAIVETRSQTDKMLHVDLIGRILHQIRGAKLPSNRQILQVLFYNMRFVHRQLRESARLSINAALIIWEQAKIPTKDVRRCIEKLENLYKAWQTIQKTKPEKRSENQIREVSIFVNQLDELFDVAHQNALEMIVREDHRQFLILQRQKGRPGCLAGSTFQRVEQKQSRKRKNEEITAVTKIKLEDEEEYEDGRDKEDFINTKAKKKKTSRHFLTPRLLSALDSASVSDGKAMHILVAAAEALGHCTSELILSRSSLHRLRQENRKKQTYRIHCNFIKELSNNSVMVVHWDGKMLPDLIGNSKVERIAVLVSYNGTSKFLGAPKIISSSGLNIAKAVHDLLIKWNIENHIHAMGFDTTSSNTGSKNGACTHLQEILGRKIINLPCRHHIFEIYLRSVFDMNFKTTQAPEVLLFERFAKSWKNIDQSAIRSGLDDKLISTKINGQECDDIKQFCHLQLKLNHSRADYEEFLKLTLHFLGDDGGKLRTPGPTSHARWMSKAIYSLKIFIFREQFKLTKTELKGLGNICIYLVRLYVKSWFGCSNAIEAPFHDLELISKTIAYANVDPLISCELLKKMKQHLWYLSEENVALAFFDSNVPLEIKEKMIDRLTSEEPTIKLIDNRKFHSVQILANYNLSDFVSKRTKEFFAQFNLSPTFLEYHPSTWDLNEQFQNGFKFCKNMFVVNDSAERGIKFIKDYNKVLTKNENEKQFLLQIVEEYRKKYPTYKKSSLI